ncbi:autotransporter-associated beta strand repeat-containing protein, partial [Prosthecobacter sp.]|uniref:autotransporter-associated beta strand repeat-containing protein n=1 Tax=Prosthecobacter sp. TaxID=1965333 RepID=UPI0024887033
MKILRHNRILLGWFMTVLMFALQVATPLQSANIYWTKDGKISGQSGEGFWNTSDAFWLATPPTGSAGTLLTWDNNAFNTAVFRSAVNVTLNAPIVLGGLRFEADGTSISTTSAANSLTFGGGAPTITIQGNSTNINDTTVLLNAPLAGTQGLSLQFVDTAGTAGASGGTLELGTSSASYASPLTGGITVGNKMNLRVVANSNELNNGRNPLGTNQVTLQTGSKLDIRGFNATSTGLSARVFNTNGTGDSGLVDFTQVAASLATDFFVTGTTFSTATAPLGVQWVGKVDIGKAGAYTFFASADDGAKLYIDGVLILNNDGGKGATDLSSSAIFLSSGSHDIRIDYVNGSGGGSLNLGYAGPDTNDGSGQIRKVIPASKLFQADVNTLGGSSTALQFGNAVRLTGNAEISLSNISNTSAQMGRLLIDNGVTLTVASYDLLGETATIGNGGGFGKTLRFGGTTAAPTVFGTLDSVTSGIVTIASDMNVAFDGVVSDQGRAMTIQKTGAGWIYFNQTDSANTLGSATSIQLIGTKVTQTATYDAASFGNDSTLGGDASTLTVSSGNTSGLSVGMTVEGAGIPAGTVIIKILNGTQFKVSGDARAVAAATSLTFSKTPTLVLTGSSAAGSFDPIGSAKIVLAGGNLVLASKGGAIAGAGPTFNNAVDVNQDAVIQNVANAVALTLSGAVTIASGKTLVLDAIAGGRPATDPGANLVMSGSITGDNTTSLVIRSTQKNAGTTVSAITALANGVVQQIGFASASGTVTLTGNNSGFAGQLIFEAGANLRVLGVNALNNKTFTMAGGTLQLLDDGDGTGGLQNLAFNHNINVAGNVTLTVGPASTAVSPFFNPAANKRAQISTLNVGNNVVTVANNNGYGLQVTGVTTLSGAPTFTVNNATTSNNLVNGLDLAGQVTGLGSILKAGSGTLQLSNASNNFGGTVTFNAFGNSGSTILTVESASRVVVGELLTSSTGISTANGGTRINSISVQNFASSVASGQTVLTLTSSVASTFAVGMLVSGEGIASGTKVASINDNVTNTTSGDTFTTPNIVTLTTGSNTEFRVGMAVAGTGIPAGTVVAEILPGNQLRLSQNITVANPTLVRRQVTLTNAVTTADTTLVLTQLNLNQALTAAITGATLVNGTSVINVTAGVLAFTSDGALGDSLNQVLVNTNSATAGLRVDGTFSSNGRTYIMNQASNAIDVTAGNTFTVNNTFNFTSNSNNLQKNDAGTLVLATAMMQGIPSPASKWNGILTIGQGVVRVTHNDALGSAGSFSLGSNSGSSYTLVANVAAALELAGGVTIGETLVFNPGNNNTSNGINGNGALRSISGNNTYSGAITFSSPTTGDNNNRAATIGVDAGSTLHITGVMTGRVGTGGSGRGSWFGLVGAGNGFIDTAMTYDGNLSFGVYSLDKAGTGTWTLTAANVFNGQNVYVNQGTLVLNGAGTLGVPGTNGGVGTVIVTPEGTLNLDSTGTNVSNRLSGRALSLYGGDINLMGNAGAATSETVGALTVNAGQTLITLTGQQASFVTGSVTRATNNGGITGTMLVRGLSTGSMQSATGGFAFTGQQGVAGTLNKGIIPWVIVDSSATGSGTSFATADSVTGLLRALDTSTEMSSTLTNNLGGVATPLNILLSTNQTISGGVTTTALINSLTVNSLTLQNGGAVTLTAGQILTLDSGGVLVLAGATNASIGGVGSNIGRLGTTGNSQFVYFTLSDLSINAAMFGVSAGLAKAGSAQLILKTQQFYTGGTAINEGVLKLDGGTNTIFYNSDFVLQGGSLDLNGNAQVLNLLRTNTTTAQNANLVPDIGGTIINTSANQATLGLVNAGGSFSGSITGNVALVRSSSANAYTDWNIYSANTYTGATLLNGGRLQLLGTATLSNTSSITLSQSTLLLSNNNATSILDALVDDRINDAAPITMRGGMIQYRARFGSEGTEAFGALTLAEGASVIDVAAPGTAINSSTATFTSLTQQAGSHGTLRIFNASGIFGNSTARVFFDNINGVSTATVGAGLTNNLIGGWAVVEREFASYSPGTGVGALNSAGYAGYSTNDINSGLATDNIRLAYAAVTSTGVAGKNQLTVATTSGLNVGDAVLGAGIPVGAVVASIIDGTKFTIDQNLGTANPTLTLPQTVTLTGNRTINSLAMVVSGDSTLDLGGFNLNLASGGLIASQGFDLINVTVNVVTSSKTSNTVLLATMPNTLTIGSTILGSTVTAINGLTITLADNASSDIIAPTAVNFVSALNMPIEIKNGNLTAGSGAADLYLHALGYVNGNGNVYGRNVLVGANIVDNGTGPVTLVIAGTEGRGVTAGVSGYRTNQVVLSGNNTYTGGTFVNSGFVVASSNTGRAFGTGDVTITGGGSTNGSTFQERTTTVMLGAADQINATATLNMLGGSVFELNNFNQTLGGLVFNNTGGNSPSVFLGNGVLTLNGNVTATSSNLGAVSTIASGSIVVTGTIGSNLVTLVSGNMSSLAVGSPMVGGNFAGGTVVTGISGTKITLSTNAINGTAGAGFSNFVSYPATGTVALSAGSHIFDIAPVEANGVNLAPLLATLNISSAMTGAASIVKTGGGLLQLSAANTFSGGVSLQNGGLLFSTGSVFNAGTPGEVSAGPIGSGTLTLSGSNNLTLLTSTSLTVGNAVTFDAAFSGEFRFDSTVSTGTNLTLSGLVTLPGAVTINVINPGMTAALGQITRVGSNGNIVINKTGLGTLSLGSVTAGNTITLNMNGGNLSLLNDGDGTGSSQVIASGITVVSTQAMNLTVGRVGTVYAPLFTTAANKTIQIAGSTGTTFTNGVLTVTNNVGYGLEITSAVTLGSNQVINVSAASVSTQIQGLTLSGIVSGPSGITKIGAGTLVLGNASNSFTGTIDIQGGIVAVSSNTALGNIANNILLNVNAATGAGLRATGTFATSRLITLNQASNAIEVTTGNTLTLNTTFGLTAVSNALQKNDNGTLELNASNGSWTGVLTIAAGAVKVSNASALGTVAGGTVVTGSGAALQLNNVSIGAEPLSLNGSGINNGGALQSLAGANTAGGAITLVGVTTIGADSGTTLTLTGGISGAQALTFAGAGNITSTTTGIGALASITKMGSGMFTLGVTSGSFGGVLVINEGTFRINSGVTIGGTGTIVVQGPSGVLDLQGGLAHMSGARALTLSGGTVNISGATGSAQVLGTLTTNRSMTNVINFGAATGTNTLTFSNLVINGDSSLNFTGTLNSTTNRIAFSTTPGMTNSIIQRALVNGTDFATYNGSGGAGNIQAFSAYNTSNNIDSLAATTNANLNLSATPIFLGTVNRTANAIKLSGSNIILGNGITTQGATLSLTAGAILNTGANNVLSSNIRIQFNAQAYVAVAAGTTLTSNSLLNGGLGFVKDLGGTLILNAPNNLAGIANISGQTLTGNFIINAGTVVLGGGNNTLTPNQFLIVATGATLDLNGTSQFAFGTRGDSAALQGNAGTFTNSSLSKAALIFGADNGGFNFGGVITQEAGAGAMSFLKSSPQQYNFLNENTYSGATVFAGGVNVLTDGGMLTNTSSIGVNYAYFRLDDNVNFAQANRVRLGADITLKGGSLVYQGRTQTESSQSVGNVILAEGYNMIQSANGGTGINSATFNISSLSRTAGSTATIRFPDNGIGAIGNTGRILITTLNGVLTSTNTGGANINSGGLVNGLIGPWAVVDREFASYITDYGVGRLNQTGFAGYSINTLNGTPIAADNIRVAASVGPLLSDTTISTLAINPSGALASIDLGGKKLTLQGGGLLMALSGPNRSIVIGNGTITAGTLNTDSDLYVHVLPYGQLGSSTVINADIQNNGTGKVRLIMSGSDGQANLTLNGTNTYTGGTVINGGVLILGATGSLAGGGITVSGGYQSGSGIFVQTAGGLIDSSNLLTVDGNGIAVLTGTQTLKGLVFNGTGGGTAAPSVISSDGVLTIGTSGVVSNPFNPAAAPLLTGRIDFGLTANSVTVNTYDFDGFTNFAPTTPGLVLGGLVGSGGGITKYGAGVLQVNQSAFTGTLTVASGNIQSGAYNSGSRFATLDLGAGTSLNLNGQATVWGGLSGSGSIFNSVANAPTLTVGYNNSDTTFSGQINRFNEAVPNSVFLAKVGTGNLTITGTQNAISGSAGAFTIAAGTVTYSGAGTAMMPTTTVWEGGTLVLDNSITNLNNRLASTLTGTPTSTLNVSGGTLNIIGNASAATIENLTTLTVANGGGAINLLPSATQGILVNVTNLSGLSTGGSLVLRSNFNNVGVTGSAAGFGNIFVTNYPNIGGQATTGNGNGTALMVTRPDVIGQTSGKVTVTSSATDSSTVTVSSVPSYLGVGSTLLGQTVVSISGLTITLSGDADQAIGAATDVSYEGSFSFVTRDSVSGYLRPLAENEMTTTLGNLSQNNFSLNYNATISSDRSNVGSLRLMSGGGIGLASSAGYTVDAFGINSRWGGNLAQGGVLTEFVRTGGIIALEGNTGITTSGLGSYTGWMNFFVMGDNTTLNISSILWNISGGIVKAGSGTLNLSTRGYNYGTTIVNEGTLILSGADNSVGIVRPDLTTGTITAAFTHLYMNGGKLDLNGGSAMVGNLGTANYLPVGGEITNSASNEVMLTTTTGSLTFGGTLTGKLGLTKTGNSNLALSNANSYTGATVVRGNTLTLQDSGTLSGTSSVTVNYSQLQWDNRGLNPLDASNPVRIAANVPLVLRGGTLTIQGGGSADTTVAFDNVSILGGGSIINVFPAVNAGSTVQLTIGNLIRNDADHGVINFVSNVGMGGTGNNNNASVLLSTINGVGFSQSQLTNKLIGGWAVVNGNSFATYLDGVGVGELGSTVGGNIFAGGNAFLAYDGFDISAATTQATHNINDSSNRTLTLSKTVNSLRSGGGTITLGNATTAVTLDLAMGLLTNTGGMAIVSGNAGSALTSSGSDLFVFTNQGTTSLNTKITGNIGLVKSGGGTLWLGPGAGVSNNYTGTTYVNQGTLVLNGSASTLVIPGDLVINNSTVTMANGNMFNATTGQIAATSNVTLNGGSTLNFFNYGVATTTTLNSLTFSNDGGVAHPAVRFNAPGALHTLVLAATNAITVVNDNTGTTPLIAA